jgi:hypothetical protein
MKRAHRSPPHRPRGLRGAGTDVPRGSRPTPGWKGRAASPWRGWRNPRTPAVPATLDITLDEYFTATTLMGLLASQDEEPDPQWACDWSFKMGRRMAAKALDLRKRRSRKVG